MRTDLMLRDICVNEFVSNHANISVVKKAVKFKLKKRSAKKLESSRCSAYTYMFP